MKATRGPGSLEREREMSRPRNNTGPDQDGFYEEHGSAEIGKSANSAVGFGKPPEHARFKPGQSGNPKGRPRGRMSSSSVIARLLNEKVTVREGDRIRADLTLVDDARAVPVQKLDRIFDRQDVLVPRMVDVVE